MDLTNLNIFLDGIPLNPLPPPLLKLDDSVPHAPARHPNLNSNDVKLALKNALRYFPNEYHKLLVQEFTDELLKYGHIYMYRFLPRFPIKAYPIDAYPAKCKEGAAIMLMIMNNLDPRVAQYPQELITYGGNGQVFSNWAQFWLTMKYLSGITNRQTLVVYSGHPMGVFPSPKNSPRAVITNGMVIPNYSKREDYDRMFALGVTMYGQMTAGSYCYIGPQGIVHGTTITILNAGRFYLSTNDLTGKVYVTSGLGGMSGAQAKAAVICGCICVIAEVDKNALNKRYEQGWLMQREYNLDDVIKSIQVARIKKVAISIGYLGNVVDLWEKLASHFTETGELLVDLGSDQTSLHNPFSGGYIPAGLTLDESNKIMISSNGIFKTLVEQSLIRHVTAVNTLCCAGMRFWDYGNSFLLEAQRAGADVLNKNACSQCDFRYPSYVQDIMGDIFSLGFGPFRWICTSGLCSDLQKTDKIAEEILRELINDTSTDKEVIEQYKDNLKWIMEAEKHKMVVGSQARILYVNEIGRVKIALALNDAIGKGHITAPIVVSRDHHDVSGTDSPYRETSNIYDGSSFCADMAIQNVIGDSFRGASWVAIHNGGGVGWGESINGGFGLLLDGSSDSSERASSMLAWDVTNGIARRCWSRNAKAERATRKAMSLNDQLIVTLPYHVDETIIHDA